MKKYIFFAATIYTMLAVSPFEMMYAAFGSEALMSDVMVATLLCTHMCLFSVFQLFSGTLLDHYGGRVFLPLSACFVFAGMFLQIFTRSSGMLLIMLFSQMFLTCGASFGFIGVEYLSRCVFSKNKAKMSFSIVQAMYGVLCAVFWVVSVHYESFMRYNFYNIVWGITILQLAAVLMAYYTADIPEIRSGYNSGRLVIASVIRHISCVMLKPDVWKIALMGGMMFGMFFALSSLLLYKCDPTIGGLASTCVWIGFALGSPISIWLFISFKDDQRVFFTIRVLQCCSLCGLIFFMQKIVGSSHDYEMLIFVLVMVLSILFGGLSGGHMIAFIMSTYVVDDSHKSVYCAIVNGFMCVISGAVMLVIAILAELYDLKTLLLYASCMCLVLQCLLERNFRIKANTTPGCCSLRT